MENKLYQIAKELQGTMEDILGGQTVGTCYLTGHCLTKIFDRLGFRSRKVTGKLAILIKNGQSRYVTYGRFPLKSRQIGVYHTWCEVKINNETFIVDPSLKANLKFVKKYFKVKIHPMVVNDTLITKTHNTYYYKYQEDINLEPFSNECLKTQINEPVINRIINRTIERVRNLELPLSA